MRALASVYRDSRTAVRCLYQLTRHYVRVYTRTDGSARVAKL